jgi:hypothetical protein
MKFPAVWGARVGGAMKFGFLRNVLYALLSLILTL